MTKPAPRAEVAARHQLGSLALEVEFSVSAPWTVLFGPSGSGKSTVLRVLAGLLRPAVGIVRLQGVPVCHTAAGLWVPSHRRAVRWAGQRAALFPGANVAENIAMGFERMPELTHTARLVEFNRALEVFGLGRVAAKRPAELSGGERQKVSVVRAAVGARGKLLLLDEPFAGLDAAVRAELITALRAWLPDSPIISVTHDVGEAFLLGAEVVRMDGGRVVAQGPVAEVLAAERERLGNVLGSC